MFRVHDARREPVTRAEQDAAGDGKGDRPDGRHYPAQVHDNRAAAEAEHVRGGDDTAFKIPRRSVSFYLYCAVSG